MARMNQYLVVWRPNAGMEEDSIATSAHRVEGWNEDYAFFGHPTRLDVVTRLYPRALVKAVEMTYCHHDGGDTLQEAKRKATRSNDREKESP